jgi:hypothetical protein
MSNSAHDHLEQNYFEQASAGPSWDLTGPNSSLQRAMPSSLVPTATSPPIPIALGGHLFHSSMGPRSQESVPPGPLTASPMTQAAGHVERAVPPLRPDIVHGEISQPALDLQGKMVCDWDECGGVAFPKRSDWK